MLGGCGYLLGDPVNGFFRTFHTCDYGSTWIRNPDTYAAKGDEAAFAASNQSLVTDEFRRMLFITGGSVPRLHYRDSGCEFDGLICYDSRPTVNLPLARGNETSGAFAMAILPTYNAAPQFHFPYTIVVVGGDSKQTEATNGVAATVYFSGVGFRSFLAYRAAARAAHTPPHGYRSAVAYHVATKIWITVGPNGTDISHDDGRNWRALKPSATDTPDADRNWNALSLPFVVGPHGRIGKLRANTLALAAK